MAFGPAKHATLENAASIVCKRDRSGRPLCLRCIKLDSLLCFAYCVEGCKQGAEGVCLFTAVGTTHEYYCVHQRLRAVVDSTSFAVF